MLERFLGRHEVVQGEMHLLNELLDLPDNDLWEIVCGRSDRYAERHRGMVARLRAS